MEHPFDPCSNLDSIDFRDNAHLTKILKRDKHTRIEGLCTEKLFLKHLIAKSFPNFSVGWWFTLKNGTYKIVKFSPNLRAIASVDLRILEIFKRKGLKSFLVGFDDAHNEFFYIDYTNLPSGNSLNEWYRERVRFPKKIRRSPPIPKPSEREKKRLEQAIALLSKLKVLKSAALERIFANCWLAGSVYWDIDCFVPYENRLLAFEVKQKYPTARGTFGLNVGLARLFTFLTGLGIEVFHIVLTKPTRDYRISAIDFYTQEKHKSKLDWLGIKFSPHILSRKSAVAPRKTSIFGSSNLRYYHLLPSDFHVIKNFNAANDCLVDFVNGKTTPSGFGDLANLPKPLNCN